MNNEFLQTEEAIVAMLKTVYDPEIPVNVYDLGLIYLETVTKLRSLQIGLMIAGMTVFVKILRPS